MFLSITFTLLEAESVICKKSYMKFSDLLHGPLFIIVGDVESGDTVPGDTVPGDTIPSDTVHGDAVPGDTVHGDAVPGDTVHGDAVPGDTVPGVTVPGDTVPGDTVPGDTGSLWTCLKDFVVVKNSFPSEFDWV
jgi:hypothetical protein